MADDKGYKQLAASVLRSAFTDASFQPGRPPPAMFFPPRRQDFRDRKGDGYARAVRAHLTCLDARRFLEGDPEISPLLRHWCAWLDIAPDKLAVKCRARSAREVRPQKRWRDLALGRRGREHG